jgi:formate/nitrite transporter FocA (FNT family)
MSCTAKVNRFARPARAFAVGSSVAATFVTLAYLGTATTRAKDRGTFWNFEAAALGVPVAYGLLNVIVNGGVLPSAKSDVAYLGRMLAAGLVMGLLFSVTGAVFLGLPKKIFGFTEKNRYAPIAFAPIMYMVIWATVVNVATRVTETAHIEKV